MGQVFGITDERIRSNGTRNVSTLALHPTSRRSGILSELALEGYVTGPLPPDTPVPNAAQATHATAQAAARKAAEAARLQACQAERREILRKAIQETDPETRRDIINSAPICPREPREK